MNVGQVILGRPWLFDKNVTIYGRSNMCQFEHKGKQIKLLPLRPKTGQLKQTSTLALLPTPPFSPPISTDFPLPLTNHAYPALKLLPPLLPTPFHYRAFESHLYLYHINTCTHFTKRSVIEINKSILNLLYELKVEKVLKFLI